jgi:hypothetical protein
MAGLAIFLTAPAVQAQLTLGVKGGVNSANLSGLPDGSPSTSSEVGFQGGAFLDVGFGSWFHLQPELLYSSRKSGLDSGQGGGTFGQNFVEIPVLFKYAFGTGLLQPALYAGPSLSFETTCNLNPDDPLDVSTSCSDDDVDTSSTNWAVVFGGELDIAVGPVILIGDIRYNLGLSDIQTDADGKWNFWSFMVGIGFGLGRH